MPWVTLPPLFSTQKSMLALRQVLSGVFHVCNPTTANLTTKGITFSLVVRLNS